MGQLQSCCGNKEVASDFNTSDHRAFFNEATYNNLATIRRIVRIQAAFRGYLARKRVQRIRQTPSLYFQGNLADPSSFNYDNPDVIVSHLKISSRRTSESISAISTSAASPSSSTDAER